MELLYSWFSQAASEKKVTFWPSARLSRTMDLDGSQPDRLLQAELVGISFRPKSASPVQLTSEANVKSAPRAFPSKTALTRSEIIVEVVEVEVVFR